MFQNIQVKSAENKTTKTNKSYKALEVQDEAGASFKTNIFSDFPDFANIIAGSSVRGKIEPNGQYWNLVSETQAAPRGGAGSAFKQQVIEKTMERKEQSIGKFQDNKDWSIKVSSTMRDAVQLALAEIKDIRTLNTLEADILKWREWLWKNWDVKEDQYPPF